MEWYELPQYYCPKRDKCKHGKTCDNRGLFRGEYLCIERAYDSYDYIYLTNKKIFDRKKKGRRS